MGRMGIKDELKELVYNIELDVSREESLRELEQRNMHAVASLCEQERYGEAWMWIENHVS